MSSVTPRIRGSEPGIHPTSERPEVKSYRSKYGPKYEIGYNWHGINIPRVIRFMKSAGLFGGVAGLAGAFFITDVPRFRIDVMEKLPIIGPYYHREVPPEDNPF